jgi:hypothetical protein
MSIFNINIRSVNIEHIEYWLSIEYFFVVYKAKWLREVKQMSQASILLSISYSTSKFRLICPSAGAHCLFLKDIHSSRPPPTRLSRTLNTMAPLTSLTLKDIKTNLSTLSNLDSDQSESSSKAGLVASSSTSTKVTLIITSSIPPFKK